MRPVLALPLLPLLLASCSSTPGGVMLGVTTDLVVPVDVTSVGLYLQHLDKAGTIREQWSFVATPLYEPARDEYVVHFPATLAVESRGVESDRIRVRAVAFAAGAQGYPEPKVVRESRSGVPTSGVASLQMPLYWLNYGTAGDTDPGAPVDGDFDAMHRFTSGCPDEQTLNAAGVCEPIDVDVETLPAFVEVTRADACFDAAAVFGGAETTRAVVDACSVQVPGLDAAQTNVAVVNPAGYVVGTEHVRPLAAGDFTVSGSTLRLEPSACAHAPSGTTLLVSTRTSAHLRAVPICSPWQVAAKPTTATDDGGIAEAPDADTPERDASTTEDAAVDASEDAAGDEDAGDDDAGPDDAGDSEADAEVIDAGPTNTWALPADYISLSAGIAGIYVSSPSGVRRYPLTPGAFEAEDTDRGYDVLVSLATPGDASDILYGYVGSVLYRIDPVTLHGTPVDVCAVVDCTAITGVTVLGDSNRRIVRSGQQLYFTTSESTAGPPSYRAYAMGLDGTSLTRVFDGITAADGNLRALIPWGSGALVATRKFISGGDVDIWQSCNATSCSLGSFPLSRIDQVGALDRLALSSPSTLTSGSLFATATWEDASVVPAGQSGLVSVVGSQLRRLAPLPTLEHIVRLGTVGCWNAAGDVIQCVYRDGGDPQTVPGASTTRELSSDATYVYWVEKNTTTLHRTTWALATPAIVN